MSEAEQDATRALLPGLHYLAVEALRSGSPAVSRVIYDAISTIENIMDEKGEYNEQCCVAAASEAGIRQPH
ncbi:hypothetical protein [Magnetospirillum moscoviense]|uniref:hypothetical protein n=1 Tax=Magnetospirillum moscoviense TaxID=1437059 RepID=UPI000AC40B4E|nr:hypothetical protein [Magnetospirillum moscoviense]MBF0327086.1 hypothetical protein [Alphaproteobacteria bacterium]